ncbi:MAG: PTS sugar transporter subunit IIA [Candidatus Thorarchaeota archaeon SMTZ1-83]|nr:MAG: hypothetical protein AM324_03165 [Candidatus Thorarchaeota archaeon SMTZ1-83]
MLTELLSPKNIGLPLRATSRDEVITELIELVAASGDISDRDEVLRKAKEREEILSTTVGKGLFVPRARSRHISRFCLSFGIAGSPLDLGALDGNPIKLCVFLGVPDGKTEEGVEYLVRIFRLFNQDSFRSALLKAKSRKDIIHVFEEEEADLER